MKKVAIYYWLARKDRKEIKEQQKILHQLAIRLCYSKFEFYIGNGSKSSTLDRSAFNKPNKAMQDGNHDVIIMRDISRITRSYLLTPKWMNEVKKQSITLLAMDGSLQVNI